MPQGFLVRVAGRTKQFFAIAVSAGAADAGKIPALDTAGRLSSSMMPAGIGANTNQATATEALDAGSFVEMYANAGTFSVRLADNSNGRPANGMVLTAVASDGPATVYPIDGVNSALSGLTVGADYWLGTAGTVISTPLDETNPSNANKISQYLGRAKSATELITEDDGWVTL